MRIQLATTPEGDCLVAEHRDEYRRIGSPCGGMNELFKAEAITLGPRVDVENVRFPYSPGKIVAVGLNYRDHIDETGLQPPSEPLLFAKFPSCVIGDGEPIEINSSLTSRVDWEVELAVVIGTTARHVARSSALSHVFGYTIANDVSARDLQFADGQWIRGKNLDTFCPLGPAVVTADAIPDPQLLDLGTRVNGIEMQRSNTARMVFGIAEIIEFCSRSFTLHPGDVILTGTPWGCGEFMSPPRSLMHGDIVEVWVDGIGSVTNSVVDIAPAHPTPKSSRPLIGQVPR